MLCFAAVKWHNPNFFISLPQGHILIVCSLVQLLNQILYRLMKKDLRFWRGVGDINIFQIPKMGLADILQ